MLIYFVVITTLYFRRSTAVDSLSALTFIFLCGQLACELVAGTTDFIKNTEWGQDLFRRIFTNLSYIRLTLFFSQNTALIVNIGRWTIVTKALAGNLDIEYQSKVYRRLKMAIGANSIYTITFVMLVALSIPGPLFYHQLIQALIVHPMTALGYIFVWRRLSRIEGFQVGKTFLFFSCILQYLVVQGIHQLAVAAGE